MTKLKFAAVKICNALLNICCGLIVANFMFCLKNCGNYNRVFGAHNLLGLGVTLLGLVEDSLCVPSWLLPR